MKIEQQTSIVMHTKAQEDSVDAHVVDLEEEIADEVAANDHLK